MSERKRDRESEGTEDSVFKERREERKMENADIMMIIEKINSAKNDTERQILRAKEETIKAFKDDLAVVNSTLHELKIENESLKKDNEALKVESDRQRSEIEDLKGVVKLQSFAIAEIQMYSRKDSLKIYNLREEGGSGGETAEQTACVVRDFFRRKLGVNVHQSDISVAHRLQAGKDNRERAIQVKFTRREVKMEVMRNRKKLKGTGVVLVEDLCSPYLRLFHTLRDLVGKGNVWTWEGKILCKVGGVTKRVTLENAEETIDEIKDKGCDSSGYPTPRQGRRGGRSPRDDRGDRGQRGQRVDRSGSRGRRGADNHSDMGRDDVGDVGDSRDWSPDRDQERRQDSGGQYRDVLTRDLERPASRASSLNELYAYSRYPRDDYHQNTRDDRGRWGDREGRGERHSPGRGRGKWRGNGRRGKERELRGYGRGTFINPEDY